jgi:hypothetical protein
VWIIHWVSTRPLTGRNRKKKEELGRNRKKQEKKKTVRNSK